jgi:hypothetical protein
MYRTLGPYAKLKKSSINNFIDETWWNNKQTNNKTTKKKTIFQVTEWTRVTLHTKYFSSSTIRGRKSFLKTHQFKLNWRASLVDLGGIHWIPYHRTDRFCLFLETTAPNILVAQLRCVNFLFVYRYQFCFVVLRCWKNEAFTRQRVSRYQFSRLISISHSPPVDDDFTYY